MCVGRRDRICIDLRQKQDVKRYNTKWRRSDLCPRAVNLFTQFLFESRFYHALSATSELMPSKQRRNTIYPELCLQPYILRQQLHPHIPRHPPSHKTHEKKTTKSKCKKIKTSLSEIYFRPPIFLRHKYGDVRPTFVQGRQAVTLSFGNSCSFFVSGASR